MGLTIVRKIVDVKDIELHDEGNHIVIVMTWGKDETITDEIVQGFNLEGPWDVDAQTVHDASVTFHTAKRMMGHHTIYIYKETETGDLHAADGAYVNDARGVFTNPGQITPIRDILGR